MRALWQLADRQWQYALECEVLQPLNANQQLRRENGVPFILRCRADVPEAVKAEAGEWCNRSRIDPFANPDPRLRVVDIGLHHRCLLNRFPVLSRHLLLVTKDFVPQNQLPDWEDFAALVDCMRWQPSLAFYNSGPIAGASQPHKHLQLTADLSATPFAPIIESALFAGSDRVPEFSFNHTLRPLDSGLFRYPADAVDMVFHAFQQGLENAEVKVQAGRAITPCNLLLTRRWLMIVPRSCETVDGLSINALGFAGNLLVRDRCAQQQLIERGLMATLRDVAL